MRKRTTGQTNPGNIFPPALQRLRPPPWQANTFLLPYSSRPVFLGVVAIKDMPCLQGGCFRFSLIFTSTCTINAFDGENMIHSTAMLLQQYGTYANPAAKIGRMVKRGELIPVIKGLYETDRSVPGHCLAGIIYGPSYLSFEFTLAWHGLIPETVYAFTSATCGKKKKKRH
ncbi:MAG: hypothetical protein IKX79_01210, partial [Desulfovibrionaceae bacterium]|nr:hypothetical protein [Desulfovibrionaceae bacterium]